MIDKLPIYGKDEDKLKPGLYLALFHGFKNAKEREETDDWGEDGPIIGPLKWCHTTYAHHIKFEFLTEQDAEKYGFNFHRMCDLDAADDCVRYRGMEYGDWTVFNSPNVSEGDARLSEILNQKPKVLSLLLGVSKELDEIIERVLKGKEAA